MPLLHSNKLEPLLYGFDFALPTRGIPPQFGGHDLRAGIQGFFTRVAKRSKVRAAQNNIFEVKSEFLPDSVDNLRLRNLC